MAGLDGQAEVLLDGQGREEVRDLERASDAGLGDRFRRKARDGRALEENVAFVRRIVPGDQVEGRGLTRAVRADQGVEGAIAHRDVDALHGLERAEALGDAAGLEDDAVHMVRQVLRKDGSGSSVERAACHGGLFGHPAPEGSHDPLGDSRPAPSARA